MYFKKGMQIALAGRLQTRSYEANDGSKRYVTEVVAEEVEFAESKKTLNNNTTIKPAEEGIDFSQLQANEFKIDVDEEDADLTFME